MAAPQVKEVEVNALLASGTLSVEGELTWKQSNEKSWYKLAVSVCCDTKKTIALRIIVSASSTDRSRITFTLLWNRNIRVRALCMNGSHGNKHTNEEMWIRKTHKHKWTDMCQDRFAYTPTDITETSVQGLLKQFCSECGITCRATVAELPLLIRRIAKLIVSAEKAGNPGVNAHNTHRFAFLPVSKESRR